MLAEVLTVVIPLIGSAVIAPIISGLVGRHVATKITENELKKSEERALKAEEQAQKAQSLYTMAINYLTTVAEWATRNGLADKLPDPPPELGINI